MDSTFLSGCLPFGTSEIRSVVLSSSLGRRRERALRVYTSRDGKLIESEITGWFDNVLRAFDVELLYIAQKLKIPITEMSVNWTEIEGSKVTPVWSWIQMGIDLGLIWLRYLIGAWKIAALKKK